MALAAIPAAGGKDGVRWHREEFAGADAGSAGGGHFQRQDCYWLVPVPVLPVPDEEPGGVVSGGVAVLLPLLPDMPLPDVPDVPEDPEPVVPLMPELPVVPEPVVPLIPELLPEVPVEPLVPEEPEEPEVP
ncbi:hypothetical protein [Noviherbaspirillum sp.]|uniref:hypothetical protein n=1 Tax=Noviherbaspirillum sp. TaxID=1926288 RepID=UPI002F92C30D